MECSQIVSSSTFRKRNLPEALSRIRKIRGGCKKVFYDFNFRGPKQHYNDTLERLYKVNCIRLLNLIANEPFGWVYNLKIKKESQLRCRMLLDNDFIPELTKRFDFIIAPGAGIVKNRDHWRWIVKFMATVSSLKISMDPF